MQELFLEKLKLLYDDNCINKVSPLQNGLMLPKFITKRSLKCEN